MSHKTKAIILRITRILNVFNIFCGGRKTTCQELKMDEKLSNPVTVCGDGLRLRSVITHRNPWVS